MDAQPDPPLFIFKQVNVVIAAADGSQLLSGKLFEVGGNGKAPGRIIVEK